MYLRDSTAVDHYLWYKCFIASYWVLCIVLCSGLYSRFFINTCVKYFNHGRTLHVWESFACMFCVCRWHDGRNYHRDFAGFLRFPCVIRWWLIARNVPLYSQAMSFILAIFILYYCPLLYDHIVCWRFSATCRFLSRYIFIVVLKWNGLWPWPYPLTSDPILCSFFAVVPVCQSYS